MCATVVRRCGCGCRGSGRSRCALIASITSSSRVGRDSGPRAGSARTPRARSRVEPVDLEGAAARRRCPCAQSAPSVAAMEQRGPRAPCAAACALEHRRARPRRSPGRRRSRAAPGSPIASSAMAPASMSMQLGRRCPPARTARAAPSSAGRRCWKAETSTSRDHLLGQRRGIDDHRVLPAGLGDQRHDRPVARGERAVDRPRRLGRAGEGDAGDARIGDQRARRPRRRRPAADAARRRARRPACSSRTAARGDQRRLLGRLGDHGVAGGQRRRDLAGEDRQREVPRADAGEDAAPVQRELVALAGRAGQRQRPAEVGARARRVVAQEIDRLAHLGDARRRCVLPASRTQSAISSAPVRSKQIGGALQASRRVARRRRRVPAGCARARRRQAPASTSSGVGLDDTCRRPRRRSAGIEHRRGRAVALLPAADQRRAATVAGGRAPSARASARSAARVGEVDAARSCAAPAPNRSRGSGMRGCGFGCSASHRATGSATISSTGSFVVDDAVDEGGVGAVLQQPAHQIGQQVLVAADRRIDAARRCRGSSGPTTSS